MMKLADYEVQSKKCRSEESKEFLQNLLTEIELEQKRADNVLRRLDGTIALVRMIRTAKIIEILIHEDSYDSRFPMSCELASKQQHDDTND